MSGSSINGRGQIGPLGRIPRGQTGQDRGPRVNQDQIVGNLGNQLHIYMYIKQGRRTPLDSGERELAISFFGLRGLGLGGGWGAKKKRA